jgi:hypothetical protein
MYFQIKFVPNCSLTEFSRVIVGIYSNICVLKCFTPLWLYIPQAEYTNVYRRGGFGWRIQKSSAANPNREGRGVQKAGRIVLFF